MSDRIVLKGLQVFARHGLLPEEKTLGQRFALDVTAFLDLRAAGRSDDYRETVCYDALTRLVIDTVTTKRFYLIEAAAGFLISTTTRSMAGKDASTVAATASAAASMR